MLTTTIELLASLLDVERRWTAWGLAAEVGVCHKTVLHIVHDILGYRKIAAHWVPHALSEHMMMGFVANKCCRFLLSAGRR